MELIGIIVLFLILFYLVGVPILLLTLRGRVRQLEEALHEQGNGTLKQRELEPVTAPPSQPSPPKKQPVQAVTAKKTFTPPPPKKPERSLEEQLGGHVFQWLGIAALIVALSVFLKWSFDNGLIGETGRIALGYLLAAAGLISGDVLRKKFDTWALAFTGGGALCAYIVTWVAVHWYSMFDPVAGFSLYVVTAAVVCLLSIRYDAIALAAFGILGGFLTPILAGTEGSMFGLLSYILVLDFAILGLGHVRQWRRLNALTFVGTVLYEIFAVSSGDLSLETGLIFVSAFTAIYLLIPIVYNIVQGKASESTDIAIILGNGALHFGITLWYLQDVSTAVREFYDVYVALTFAVLYLLWSVGVFAKNKNDTPLVLSGLSLTVLFASLAIPLQLGAQWTSVAWSIEAAMLLWISLQLKDNRIQHFAWPVMGIAYVWYLAVPVSDSAQYATVYSRFGMGVFLVWIVLFLAITFLAMGSKDAQERRRLLLFALLGGVVLCLALLFVCNAFHIRTIAPLDRFIRAAALIGGSYAVLWKASMQWNTLTQDERQAFGMLGLAVQIVTLLYITYEFVQAVDTRKLFTSVREKRQVTQVGMSIIWALYASATLVVGIVKHWKLIRLFSLVLLLLAIAKLALIDFAYLGTAARVVGFTVLGVLLVAASFVYQKNKDTLTSFFIDSPPKK